MRTDRSGLSKELTELNSGSHLGVDSGFWLACGSDNRNRGSGLLSQCICNIGTFPLQDLPDVGLCKICECKIEEKFNIWEFHIGTITTMENVYYIYYVYYVRLWVKLMMIEDGWRRGVVVSGVRQ